MAQVKLIDSIKANKLFEHVSPDDIKLGVNQKDLFSFKEGDIIFQTGDSSDQVFLLIDGEVKIKYVAPIDGQRIFEKEQGDFFGEKEFLERLSRRSSAVANRPVTVYVLHRKELNDLISKHHEILNSIQRLDPSRNDLPDLQNSKEIYSEEINNILKTPDSSLEPFGYASKKPATEVIVDKPADNAAQDEKADSAQSVSNGFPKKINRTFEDSFNFSNIETASPEEPKEQPAPAASVGQSPGPLSWDFTGIPDQEADKPEGKPASQSAGKPEPEAHEEFHFPAFETEVTAAPEKEDVSLNWKNEAFSPQTETEASQSPFHFGDISKTPIPDENKAPEPKPEQIELPTAETAPVESEPSEEGLTWDFSKEETEPVVPDKTTETPLKTTVESSLPGISDEKEETTPVWFGNDLSEDQPIKEFEFDEFGNLIASPATAKEPVEELPAKIEPESNQETALPTPEPVFDFHEEAELEEEKFIFNDAPEAVNKKFGDEGYHFTAPLESKSPQPAYVPPKGQGDELNSDQLWLIIEAAQLVNSNIKLDEVLNSIVQAASLLTQADRGTLYIVDHANHEIWSKVIRGEDIEEIRLNIGQGLAGWVAQTGETINIEDVSHDTRFDANIDRQTGYKTRSMLCFPIRNKAGIIIAVIQLLNSKRGTFTSLDETFLTALSVHIAIALENAELVEQLLKTDRLTSLGKVAKFLISDIKKPILTIKHLAEHIRKKNVSADVNQVISMMIEQSNIVVDLVLTTLSFSEGKAVLNKKVIGSHRVLTELLDLLAEYVEYRKTKLFKKLGPDVLLNIDRREMYQAFFQITKNACDAMPQGGELYITARTSEDDSKLIIAFRDKGVGIPPSILEKILEPFMSHGKPHGVGLGLPITEKIVKEHEGTLHIESELGEGATVTIELPIMKEF